MIDKRAGLPCRNLGHVRLCARCVREPPLEYCFDIPSRGRSRTRRGCRRRLCGDKSVEAVESERSIKHKMFQGEHHKGVWWIAANEDGEVREILDRVFHPTRPIVEPN